MKKEEILDEMQYAVVDEIHTDISYLSSNGKGYQYLTGIEFGMLVATGISSLFLIPFIAGFSNKLGEALAEHTVKKLELAVSGVKSQLKDRKTQKEIRRDLEAALPDDVISLLQSDLWRESKQLEAVKRQQEKSIQEFLRENHFPEEKLDGLSGKICRDIYDIFG